MAERLAGQDVRPLNYDHVPSCTYCDPEIGSVGLTEAAAKNSEGYSVRVGSFPFGVLGRAKMAGETEGFVKIVADRKYPDEVLGVHMIGARSTELIAEAVLALRLECTVEELIRRCTHTRRSLRLLVRPRTQRMARRFTCRVRAGVHEPMPTPIVMPQMGRINRRRDGRPLDEAGSAIWSSGTSPCSRSPPIRSMPKFPLPQRVCSREITVKEGETVPVNSVVGTIVQEGEVLDSGGPRPAGAVLRHREVRGRTRTHRARSLASYLYHRAQGPRMGSPNSAPQEVVAGCAPDRARPSCGPDAHDGGSGVSGRVTKQDILAFVERNRAAGGRRTRQSVLESRSPESHRLTSRATAWMSSRSR